jgi:hypothetical protein
LPRPWPSVRPRGAATSSNSGLAPAKLSCALTDWWTTVSSGRPASGALISLAMLVGVMQVLARRWVAPPRRSGAPGPPWATGRGLLMQGTKKALGRRKRPRALGLERVRSLANSSDRRQPAIFLDENRCRSRPPEAQAHIVCGSYRFAEASPIRRRPQDLAWWGFLAWLIRHWI